MKFFLLLLLSCLFAAGFADDGPGDRCVDICDGDRTLRDADCTGFKVRNDDFWDEYAIWNPETQECKMAVDSDVEEFNQSYLCCSENESDCCKDYPNGFYAGFAIGLGGVVCMTLYAIYLCFGSSSESKTEG